MFNLKIWGCLILLLGSGAASATCIAPPTAATGGPLQLNYQELAPGSGAITVCATPTAASPSVTSSWTYGDTFPAQTVFYTSTSGTQYSFYDDYAFSIAPSTADAVTSEVTLGSGAVIRNLDVRIYSTGGNSILPVLGTPNGTVYDAMTSTVTIAPGITVTEDVLQTAMLQAGTYVLEVRGDAVGTGGPGSNSYSGTLNLTPVPLPAALPLMFSGLGLLGGLARRRRKV